jgi:anti-sigma factor RsiW
MTDDDVRDRFSDAIEGELSAEDKVSFEAALEKSDELREEYESFRTMMRGTAKLAENTEAEVDEKAPEILAKVQDRIHKRSKGRFYRDRFARDGGRRSSTMLVTILVVLTLAAAALALQNLVVIEDAPPVLEEAPAVIVPPPAPVIPSSPSPPAPVIPSSSPPPSGEAPLPDQPAES